MGANVYTHFDTTSNKDLLKSGSLRRIHDTTVRKAVVWSKKLYNVKKTNDEYERDLRMAGLSNVSELSEGQNIPIQAPVLGTTKTYTQRQFGSGFRMTFRMDKFNKFNLFNRWAEDLGRRQTESKDIELAVPFVSPTSTSLTCGTGFDSKAIGDDAHTGLATGTGDNYDNLLDVPFSQAGLESMRYYFATLIDDMGNLMGGNSSGGVLYYSPTLWPSVNEIFYSKLRAQELSNTDNIVPKMGVEPYEYPRISASTTAWGVAMTGHPKYDMNLFTSLEPKLFVRDAYDQTLDKVAISIQMFTYGWGDPRTILVGKT